MITFYPSMDSSCWNGVKLGFLVLEKAYNPRMRRFFFLLISVLLIVTWSGFCEENSAQPPWENPRNWSNITVQTLETWFAMGLGVNDILPANVGGGTPLHAVIPRRFRNDPDRNIELVEYLVESGADIEARLPSGLTPLMGASNSVSITQYLLVHGAHVNASDIIGRTALSEAIKEYPAYTMREQTPVEERLEIVRVLVEAGADPNAKDEGGITALMLAAMSTGDTGWFYRNLNSGFTTALRRTTEGWVIIPWESFDNGRPGEDRIIQRNDRISVMNSLLEAGADIEQRDIHGSTALVYAVEHNEGESEIVQFLLDSGADPYTKDDFRGSLLFHFSPWSGDTAVLQILLDEGLDPNERSIWGETVLTRMVQDSENPDVISILLDA